jgi:uncharacterized RDD family membrane protein YckC
MWTETQKLFLHRLAAKLFDFVLVFWMIRSFDAWLLSLLSLAYLAFSDGLFFGQSLGKRIMGLRVVRTHSDTLAPMECDFYHSVIRNGFFALIIFLSWIPVLGVVFVVLGLLFIGIEIYFMYTDDDGLRIGDIYAKTTVVMAPPAAVQDSAKNSG